MNALEYHRVVEPPRGVELNLSELFRERELLAFLTWRNLQVRYKQSLAGPGWAILQPVIGMLIFWVVFGRYAKLPNDGIPSPVFYLSAFMIWSYVGASLTLAAGSVADNAAMVSKVYFPRIFLPLSAGLAGLVDRNCDQAAWLRSLSTYLASRPALWANSSSAGPQIGLRNR